MTFESPLDSQWNTDNNPEFLKASQLSGYVDKLNTDHAELVQSGQVTLEPFQEAVTTYLMDEQLETFGKLKELADRLPYAEIATEDIRLSIAMGGVAIKLASLEDKQNEEAALIAREQENIAGRLPELAPKLQEIAARMQQSLTAKNKARLEKDRSSLQDEYDALAIVYEAAGQAWAIPQLISTRQQEQPVTEIQIPNRPIDAINVDDFPEKNFALTKEQVAEKVRRKYPEEVLKDASEFVALFLAEEPKHAYVLQELADVLYGPEETKGKGRVSALISNFELGKVTIIGTTLIERGLVFQRGVRKSYVKETGKSTGSAQPVFRAITPSDANNKERVVHVFNTDGSIIYVNETWRTVVYEQSVRTATPVDAKAEAGQSEPTKSPIPTTELRLQPELPKEPEWKTRFRTDVAKTIQQFEDDGIMVAGEVLRRIVSIKSSSRNMGTDEMMERAVKNGIIKPSETELEQPLYKYVCMALQNQHPELFSNRTKRKQVVAMAEEAVAKYFTAKKSDR